MIIVPRLIHLVPRPLLLPTICRTNLNLISICQCYRPGQHVLAYLFIRLRRSRRLCHPNNRRHSRHHLSFTPLRPNNRSDRRRSLNDWRGHRLRRPSNNRCCRCFRCSYFDNRCRRYFRHWYFRLNVILNNRRNRRRHRFYLPRLIISRYNTGNTNRSKRHERRPQPCD